MNGTSDVLTNRFPCQVCEVAICGIPAIMPEKVTGVSLYSGQAAWEVRVPEVVRRCVDGDLVAAKACVRARPVGGDRGGVGVARERARQRHHSARGRHRGELVAAPRPADGVGKGDLDVPALERVDATAGGGVLVWVTPDQPEDPVSSRHTLVGAGSVASVCPASWVQTPLRVIVTFMSAVEVAPLPVEALLAQLPKR